MKYQSHETGDRHLPGEFPPVCKGCKERRVGCHSECRKYLDAKEEYEKRRGKERQSWAITENGARAFFANPGGDYVIKKTRWRKKGIWPHD